MGSYLHVQPIMVQEVVTIRCERCWGWLGTKYQVNRLILSEAVGEECFPSHNVRLQQFFLLRQVCQEKAFDEMCWHC